MVVCISIGTTVLRIIFCNRHQRRKPLFIWKKVRRSALSYIAASVLQKLKEKEADLYVEFTDSGVKDIILPGEVRDIMNTVLIAEKRAQANVITRREEVASTRSLLNTAKLMDENTTLYKLKELEYIEKICDKVGNISVGNSDILGQLNDIFIKK